MNREIIDLKKRIALNLLRVKKKLENRLHELSYLFWECTLRCNLSCVHCGSDCRKDAVSRDMPLADFLRVLDSLQHQVVPLPIVHGHVVVHGTGDGPLDAGLVHLSQQIVHAEAQMVSLAQVHVGIYYGNPR